MPFISTVSRKFAFGRSRAYYKSLQLEHTLDNPNPFGTSLNDFFGFALAVSDNYAIVSASGEDDAGGTGSGKAYIYNATTGALLHTLDNPNAFGTSANDTFGRSVAISGNYAIVGAGSEADAGGTFSGKAYIFNVTTGNLVHTLDNPNAYSTSTSDFFGNSVAISDNYAIVGAFTEDDAGGTGSGKAYIYDISTFTTSTISSATYVLDNPNAYGTSAEDRFGVSVAISGDRAIVGAYQEDDTGGSNIGKAYIFNVTDGSLVHTLNNPNNGAVDNFGFQVDISGDYAIVGSRFDHNGGDTTGRAYVFDVTSGNLLYTLNNPNTNFISPYDFFGSSVAISGNYAIVGAQYEDDAGGTDSGKAYIFDVSSGNLLYTIDNPNAYGTSAGDRFGWKVAISGDRAIVGAYAEDDAGGTNSSKAYIYKLSDSIQYRLQNLYALYNPNAFGTSADDYFGYSVAISGDRAIVGAMAEFGAGEDDAGGTSSGKAYIFDVTSGNLLYTLDNPNAYNTSADDRFGISVAISGDRAIVGAYREDDAGGSNSGKAYIFDVTDGSLVHTLDNPNAYDTSASDFFGESVAIDGNYAIVGAPDEDDAGGGFSGKAYIFDVTTGSLLYTLDNPNAYDTSFGDFFGHSVAVGGNYAIVGAKSEDDAGGTNSGKAYIYDISTFTTSTISSATYVLNNPNAFGTSAGDEFGSVLAISGNYAIVSSEGDFENGEDDAGGTASGKAYIFDVTSGSLVHTLDNPNAYDTSASDFFGRSVAISGNYAIAGAWGEDDAGGLGSGKAYIFDVTTGSLLYTLDNPNAYDTSAGDLFGFSVGISGNRAIVGARGEDDAGGGSSGAAYVFELP